jgi:hypothetical protein
MGILDTYKSVYQAEGMPGLDSALSKLLDPSLFTQWQDYQRLKDPAQSTPIESMADAPQMSPELTAALQKIDTTYQPIRLGGVEGGNDRRFSFVDRATGETAVTGDPSQHTSWYDAPIEGLRTLGSAYLGASAINGGLLGAGGAAAGEGAAAAAGGLELSGQMPVYQAMSSSQLPAIAGAGAATTIPMGGYAGAGLEAGGTAAGVSSGGGLLNGALGKYAPGVASFIKDNPLLSKALFSAATGLLSASGGGGGGGKEPTFGPAKQWKSPLQQGLIGNPQLTDIAKPVSFKGRWS